MVTFPKSRVDLFRHDNPALRYGQAFFNYMKLHRVNDRTDKAFFARLYNEVDELKAKQMIASRVDVNN